VSRRGEIAAYGLLVIVALALRLIELGERPFHHDESQDAYFSWVFFRSGDYEYQPILHGPLRFYLTAASYLVLGASDFSARLAPALMGATMVALPFGLRHQLGRVACFAAAALLAVGPTYLYFSRFAREDIYIACITLALLVVVFRFLDAPRRHHPALIGALLAASFATKESTFITVFVAGTFFLVVIARSRSRDAMLGPIRAVGWEAWAWGLAAFAVTFTILFTTFLTNPGGLWDGIYEGLSYWLGQHGVGRGGEPWFFYLVLLFGHEWPTLLLAAVGAVVALRQPTLLRAFLVWMFVLSLAVYSWAGEKFAWLALHPLLPLVFLAGLGVQTLWAARGTPAGRAGLAAGGVAAAYLVFASFLVNARHAVDPRELIVSTQSSADVKRVADRVVALAARVRKTGREPILGVDAADGATFPWAWYFREEPVSYLDYRTQPPPANADALILTEASATRLAPTLAGYDARRFRFRVWWVRDYGAQSPGAWTRWMLSREPWNPTGGMPAYVYLRRGDPNEFDLVS
jgi:uncharacterized protein (TIGR03663 family)